MSKETKWTYRVGGRVFGHVVRVPNDAWNGSTGRRWFAIANERGLGHFRNKRSAIAAVLKAVSPVAKAEEHAALPYDGGRL